MQKQYFNEDVALPFEHAPAWRHRALPRLAVRAPGLEPGGGGGGDAVNGEVSTRDCGWGRNKEDLRNGHLKAGSWSVSWKGERLCRVRVGPGWPGLTARSPAGNVSLLPAGRERAAGERQHPNASLLFALGRIRGYLGSVVFARRAEALPCVCVDVWRRFCKLQRGKKTFREDWTLTFFLNSADSAHSYISLPSLTTIRPVLISTYTNHMTNIF